MARLFAEARSAFTKDYQRAILKFARIFGEKSVEFLSHLAFMNYRRACPALLALGIMLWSPLAQAQETPTGVVLADRLSGDLGARLQAATALLDADDARSARELREVAQSALQTLQSTTKTDVLSVAPGALPADSLTLELSQQAARAHWLWGVAAERFTRRDEAITALARARRLVVASAGARGDSILLRDINLELGAILSDGLPLIAPTDVLGDIAQLVHGNQWTPRSFGFDANNNPIGEPQVQSSADDGQLLVTDGQLFPPPLPGASDLEPRTPSLYRSLDAQQLPVSLKLNKMVAGYARQRSGPNQGQWRQIVRVLYASERLTENKRADLPRARALAEQFLKVHAYYQDELGLSNLYPEGDRDAGVTTLWLLEVSALWPADEKDPRVLAQLGPQMPAVNTGKSALDGRPETTALMRPWIPIAGNMERAPGEILFWKAGLARHEAEWLRELFHEYGHVTIPPIGGFRAPLEPYANGFIGETLGMMWAANKPDEFALQVRDKPAAPTFARPAATVATATANSAPGETNVAELSADIAQHLQSHALPARALFVAQGPNAPLAETGDERALIYLSGLTVYLERVYGAPLLGRALSPLAQRARQTEGAAARRGLLRSGNLFSSIETTWQTPWRADKTLPIWLPGALNAQLDAPTLVNRGAITLPKGTRASTWLWVPPGTGELRIEGAGAGNLSVIGAAFAAKSDIARVYFGANGWQKITLVAQDNATIGQAKFVRK